MESTTETSEIHYLARKGSKMTDYLIKRATFSYSITLHCYSHNMWSLMVCFIFRYLAIQSVRISRVHLGGVLLLFYLFSLTQMVTLSSYRIHVFIFSRFYFILVLITRLTSSPGSRPSFLTTTWTRAWSTGRTTSSAARCSMSRCT